jgi:hypothetical protein
VSEELENVTREHFKRYEAIKTAETQYEYNGPEPAEADIKLATYGTSMRMFPSAK